MRSLNILLAQFLFLTLVGGVTIAIFLIRLFESHGFTGEHADIVAALLSLLVIAIFVFARWKLRRKNQPPIEPDFQSRHAKGNAFVTFGNAIVLLVVVPSLFLGKVFDLNATLIGVLVVVGGFIALVAWLIGWSLIRSSVTRSSEARLHDKQA